MVKIVGILNVTPDSFSDGGLYTQLSEALLQTQRMIDEGADIIDIGAESTRPGATAISVDEEFGRLSQILDDVIKLAHKHHVKVSIDTYKPKIAEIAINSGVDIINDVSGFTSHDMIDLVAKHKNIKLVAMHNLGLPAERSITLPENTDVIRHILNWGESLLDTLEEHGIKRSNVAIDPGIGFGKTALQSWYIVNNIEKLKECNAEIYVGHSRKGFLALDDNRDACTLATSLLLASKKVNYLRVHNVGLHARFFSQIGSFINW